MRFRRPRGTARSPFRRNGDGSVGREGVGCGLPCLAAAVVVAARTRRRNSRWVSYLKAGRAVTKPSGQGSAWLGVAGRSGADGGFWLPVCRAGRARGMQSDLQGTGLLPTVLLELVASEVRGCLWGPGVVWRPVDAAACSASSPGVSSASSSSPRSFAQRRAWRLPARPPPRPVLTRIVSGKLTLF